VALLLTAVAVLRVGGAAARGSRCCACVAPRSRGSRCCAAVAVLRRHSSSPSPHLCAESMRGARRACMDSAR